MKKILVLLVFVYSSISCAAAPYGIAGQDQAVTYPNVHKVPYSQVTGLGGINALIETGNENILVNPGFEGLASTVPAGWTCTTGACTKTTTSGEFSSGKAAMKVALSAQAMNVSQTVNTASGIQKQGFARVIYKVPSTMADFQVCTLVDAVEQTCVPSAKLVLDNTFRSIEIPLTFGSTSAGIKFKTTSAYTADAFFDGAILAQGLGLQNLQLDNVYSANITTTSGSVTGENKDFISSCTAANPTVCTYNAGYFAATPNCTIGVFDGGSTRRTVLISASSATSITLTSTSSETGVAVANISFNLSCQKSGNDYLAASANVYSQASADTDWASCGLTTSDFTGFGTVTGIEALCQRSGSNLNMRVKWANGTVSGSEARVNLKIANTSLTSASTSVIPSISIAGVNTRNAAVVSAQWNVLIEPSVGYVTFGRSDSTGGLTKCTGSSCWNNTETNSFFASVPIAGWSNANVIVGSFAGYVAQTGATNPVSYKASVTSSGVVTENPGTDWINGNCAVTSTNVYTCTLNASRFSNSPICTLTIVNPAGAGRTAVIFSASSSTIVVNTYTTGAIEANAFNISCDGVR